MKALLRFVALVTTALVLQTPVLGQDDTTVQVFEGALTNDPAAESGPAGFGRRVAASATNDGQALGESVSDNVSDDSGNVARDLDDETRELRQRSSSPEIRRGQ